METASEQPEFDKLVARRFLETRIEVGLAQRNPPLHRPRLVVKKIPKPLHDEARPVV
jgi:hypothetical protein